MPSRYPNSPESQDKTPFISDAEKDRLKREIDFLALVQHLGVENIKQGRSGQYTANSIFVEDDKRHLSFNIDKRVFQCFKSGESGDVFRLIMLAQRCSFHEAVRYAKNFDDGIEEAPVEEASDTVRRQIDGTLVRNPALGFELKGLFKKHPYFEEKGFTPETVETFGLGWQKAGSMGGRIVYPLHDEEGTLVAYAGRAIKKRQIEEEGKYKIPSGLHKSLLVYNLHRVTSDPEALALVEKHGLVIVEGFNDAIKLWQQGYKNVVALIGNSMSAHQQELLLQVSDRFILFLDNNTGGRRGVKKILNRPADGGTNGLAYRTDCFVRLARYPDERREPEELSFDELQEVLFPLDEEG